MTGIGYGYGLQRKRGSGLVARTPAQFISAFPNSNTATPTWTTYQTDDLIIAFSGRNANTTIPTMPTGLGWNSIATISGNGCGAVLAWRRAMSNGADGGLGTWTNGVTVYATFRNVDWTSPDPIGAFALQTAAGASSIVNPGLTLEDTQSLVMTGAFTRANDPVLRNDVTLLSARINTGLRYTLGYSTAAPVASWDSQTVNNTPVATSSGHVMFAIEVMGKK